MLRFGKIKVGKEEFYGVKKQTNNFNVNGMLMLII